MIDLSVTCVVWNELPSVAEYLVDDYSWRLIASRRISDVDNKFNHTAGASLAREVQPLVGVPDEHVV